MQKVQFEEHVSKEVSELRTEMAVKCQEVKNHGQEELKLTIDLSNSTLRNETKRYIHSLEQRIYQCIDIPNKVEHATYAG